MRRSTTSLVCLAVLGTAAVTLAAVTGRNGHTATGLFETDHVLAEVTYNKGFEGTPWGNVEDPHGPADRFEFGVYYLTVDAAQRNVVAADSAGNVYFTVNGDDLPGWDTTLHGLIRFDGSGFHHLVQDTLRIITNDVDSVGSFVRGVVVSPVTSGLLTEDHPVITRISRPDTPSETHFQVWTVDPDSSPPTETLVYEWDSYSNGDGILAIADDGTLYVLAIGLLDGTGNDLHQTLRALKWNGSSYDDSSVSDEPVSDGLAIANDGGLLTFPAGSPFGLNRKTVRVLRFDPSSGDATEFARIKSKGTLFYGMTVDGAGTLLMALRDNRNPGMYVTPVRKGRTLRPGRAWKRRIAEVANSTQGLAHGLDDGLYVLDPGTVHRIEK